jgi:serine phosphatase RsbU (regulator of sigma subunit)
MQYREKIGLDVLNICDTTGKQLAGTYSGTGIGARMQSDPILRRALEGELVCGTVLLSGDRILEEGGASLRDSLAITEKAASGGSTTQEALFWWVAAPIRQPGGKVTAVLYGGRALNMNFGLVDDLRDMVFSTSNYKGKPLGTVTIFLNDLRVATNVLGPDQQRAVGTRVSREVRESVLGEGQRWKDRAFVVDEWYLSAYQPIREPGGRIIGMLYVGLLEAPYADLRWQMITKLLGVMLLLAIPAVGISIFMVRRITSPLRDVSKAAKAMAKGEQDSRVALPQTYSEIRDLTGAFREMQDAIALRDRNLKDRNRDLKDANERMKNDLDAAAMVQRGLLPKALPDSLCAEFAWHFEPCDELGGDILNVLPLNNRSVAMYILDVSGHGVPAALLSVTLSRVMTARDPGLSLLIDQATDTGAAVVAPPRDVAVHLNRQFPMTSMHDKYFTMAYAVLDTKTRELHYTLAGHPPPILLRQDHLPQKLGGRGLPIGIEEDEEFEDWSVQLEPGDRLFLYSDGITEAWNSEREMLEIEGLMELIGSTQSDPLSESLEKCIEGLNSWCGSVPFSDDLSLLALEIPETG